MKLSLKNREWKEFELGKLFIIQRGKRLIASDRKKGNLPYFSATATNNGLTDFIKNPLFIEKDKIIVTTFCDAYYVKGNFTASDEITMMSNQSINEYSGRFITRIIVSNQSKYAFGRKAFSERLEKQKILLPVTSQGDPDYEFMEKYMHAKEQEKINAYKTYISKRIKELENVKPVVPLKEKKWAEFLFPEIFDIKKGFYNKKPQSSNKGKIPFIGASQYNNGITEFYTLKEIEKNSKTGYGKNDPLERKIFKGNCIAVTNNGSVGYAYYQKIDFTCSHDINPLYLKNYTLNRYIAMFLIAAIEKQKVCFEYARKWRPIRMVKSKILLPVTPQGKPDYEYMENYMKRLELEKLKKYLDYKERNERKTV